MSFVYISHANQDKPMLRPITDALIEAGHKLWIDQPDQLGYESADIEKNFFRIHTGRRWEDEINEALHDAACIVVCWSHNAARPGRDFLLKEINYARVEGKLVACRIDDVAPATLPGTHSSHEVRNLSNLEDARGAAGMPEPRDPKELDTALGLFVDDVANVCKWSFERELAQTPDASDEPDVEEIAAETAQSPPDVQPPVQEPFAQRVRAAVLPWLDRTKGWALSAWNWLKEHRGRTGKIAAAGAAFAATWAGLVWAALTFHEVPEMKERPSSPAVARGLGEEMPVVMGYDHGGWDHGSGTMRRDSGHGRPVAYTLVTPRGRVLAVDVDGRLRLADPEMGGMFSRWMRPGWLETVVREGLWKPLIRPLANGTLRLTAWVIDIPELDHWRARRVGTLRDCTDCPQMIFITAPATPLTTWDTNKSFAASRQFVTVSEWDACAKAGGKCTQINDDADSRAPPITGFAVRSYAEIVVYLEWLNTVAANGRRYSLIDEQAWVVTARLANARASRTGLLFALAQVGTIESYEWAHSCRAGEPVAGPPDGCARARASATELARWKDVTEDDRLPFRVMREWVR